jgi:Kef-type K+ transport system membrane component KefB/nucleotide-binding universal stress UspA family protein
VQNTRSSADHGRPDKGDRPLPRGLRLIRVPAALGVAAVLALPLPAGAAEPASGPSEVVLFVQIAVLLTAAGLMGEIMQRIGQPAVMGQLLAGVMLGPSVLGALWPSGHAALFPASGEQKAMLAGIAHVGILLLLLLTGMETDAKLARKVGRTSMAISVTGLAVPFACGFGLGQFIPDHLLPHPEMRLVTSLFLGTALSISSVKIVAAVIREMNFIRRNIGQVIIAAAIIEDSIGWIIIAITLGIATQGSLDLGTVGTTVLGTLLFLAVSFTVGRRLVARLIRWANDSLVVELPVVTVILILMAAMAVTTDAIGVHTVLGAFIAGMLVGQSPILTRHIDGQLRGLITALFMPIFFAVAGLSADLRVLADPSLLGLTGLLLAIASVGKFGGAFLGGRMGGLTFGESLAVGSAMNARGSTEVIVASVGLSMGALSQNLYTMIVAMAVLTTLAMPPLLRWALLRLPLRDDERERLEQEERESRGFLAGFERILVVADQSPKGRLAARVAGLLAGTRQITTTVLELPAQKTGRSDAEEEPAAPEVVKSSAQSAQEAAREGEEAAREGEDGPAEIEVTGRAPGEAETAAAAVEREVRKGYDLMVIGVDPVCTGDGLVSPRVTELAGTFQGPLAIVDARGAHLGKGEPAGPFSILLPVRGTPHSQRAAEFAVELARAAHATLEAVYVTDRPALSWRTSPQLASGLEEDAALKQAVSLADAHGVPVRTSLERGAAAPAVLDVARRNRHDLIVMGVARRPGERLFFGKVASEVLDRARCSLVLVVS